MKRNSRRRQLSYEQLESKALPSSLLMAVSGEAAELKHSADAIGSLTNAGHYETEQILRFVAVNAGGERMTRPGMLPTAAQCAAADEMMKLAPAEWNSLIVLGYYVDGTEL